VRAGGTAPSPFPLEANVATEEGKKRQAEAVAAANRRRKGEKRPEQASTHTPESDAKRSEAMKRRWADPEYRARLSEADKASRTPESNARRSETHKEIWQDPEYRARRAETEARPETKARRSAAAKAMHANPENKERHRKALQSAWADPSPGQLASLDALLTGAPVSPLEARVIAVLIARQVSFVVHKTIGRYQADLYIPELNLDIECDGRYWHNHPDRMKHDAKRDAWLTSNGHKVLRLTQAEITAGDFTRLDEIITKVREAPGFNAC
jgi:very-short-patch-repair endonuclease